MAHGQVNRVGLARSAAALRTTLCDRKMVSFDAPRLVGAVPRAGRIIEDVERHGKHLEIRWDDGMILHTHFRLNGSWHVHHSGDSWLLPHNQLRVRIEVPGWVALCFGAATVETYRAPGAGRHPGLGGVGPDISRADADLGRCADLLLSSTDRTAPLADVLLEPHALFGLGNVYRSEVLWHCGLSPFAPIGDLAPADAVRLVNVAATLVRANLRHPEVVTMPGVDGDLAVYGRRAQPCRRCGESIRERATGVPPRSVYWCAGCQRRGLPAHSAAMASNTFIRDAFRAG